MTIRVLPRQGRPRPRCATFVAHRRSLATVGALIIAASATGAPAQETPESAPIRPPRVSGPIEIDGDLSEPAWEGAAVIPLPFEVQPGKNEPADVLTECRILYGGSALYVGCRAWEPSPDRVRAHLADRDVDTGDDQIVVRLDTFRDRRRAFLFAVNPLGVQRDALTGSDFTDFTWDAIWSSAGRLTDEGYVVELAVPYRALRFRTGGKGLSGWGVLIERVRPRRVNQILRSARMDYGDPCRLCEAQPMAAPPGVSSGIPVELNPTLTLSGSEVRPDPSSRGFSDRDFRLRVGAFARWRATPSVVLAATANPDFSQVESDAARLDLNRRFTLFFPEKRPFFLEGTDLFETPGDPLVFTRTVTDPAVAAKLVGKMGPSSFGVMVARDDVTSVIVPGPEASDEILLDRDHTSAVLRYRRDVGRSSSLGGIATYRAAESYENLVAGADGLIQPGGGFEVGALLAASRTTQGPVVAGELEDDSGTFRGIWTRTLGRFETRDWQVTGRLEARSADFRADAGFVPEVGFREASLEFNRLLWSDGPGRWFTVIGVGLDLDYGEFADGSLRDRSAQVLLDYNGPAQLDVDLDFMWEDQALEGRLFAKHEQELEVSVVPWGGVNLELELARGRDIDTRNLRPADKLEAAIGLGWRIGRPASLDLSFAFERLSVDGQRLFTESASNLTVEYHFDRRFYIRAIVRLQTESRNAALFEDPVDSRERRVSSQVLFTYEVDPRSAVFLGYSDGWEGSEEVPLRQTRRTLFAKLGYALRL